MCLPRDNTPWCHEDTPENYKDDEKFTHFEFLDIVQILRDEIVEPRRFVDFASRRE